MCSQVRCFVMVVALASGATAWAGPAKTSAKASVPPQPGDTAVAAANGPKTCVVVAEPVEVKVTLEGKVAAARIAPIVYRAEVLKQRGISASYVSPNAAGIPEVFKDPEGFWTGFSARVRILVVNQGVAEKPQSILAYTDARWKGRAVVANPLFGTTTTQMAALFTLWGDARATAFLEAMKDNGTQISTDNGESTDLVASGEFDFSLVDSDDGVNRIRQGKPIVMVYPDQGEDGIGCLIVPNAVVLIKGAPHPSNARKLMDYLLSKETEQKLAFADCAQIPLHAGVEIPSELKVIEQLRAMEIDYAAVARKLLEIQPFLKSWVGY